MNFHKISEIGRPHTKEHFIRLRVDYCLLQCKNFIITCCGPLQVKHH